MPVAGDEGYETLVLCPYDRSHEIRRGRMQFHLDKCRKNFPEKSKVMMPCPYNTTHLIAKFELQFHTEEECKERATWDRVTHDFDGSTCPVEGLVPVNAATVPDGDENWDDFECPSVLNIIRTTAAEKPIIRMMQCESKAKRKNFRREERIRLEQLTSESRLHSSGESSNVGYAMSDEAKKVVTEDPPLPRSRNTQMLINKKQDPQVAAAVLSSKFRTLDLGMKAVPGDRAPSDTSSMFNGPPSEAQSPSVTPLSFGSAAQVLSNASDMTSQPSAPMSYASASSRPSTAMSTALSNSRPSTAMSIESSAKLASKTGFSGTLSEDRFCQIPIPGLGRGSRRKMQ